MPMYSRTLSIPAVALQTLASRVSPWMNPAGLVTTLLFASMGAFGTPRAVAQDAPAPVRHVIHISVDGLRPDAVTRHDPDDLPNFYRLRAEGAFTDNARTDSDYSITLPNHMAQLTGRAVLGSRGHNWTDNGNPKPGETLHSRKGAYVASAFDVVHDHGLRTGAYVSKSKFVLLDRSYDEAHGAPDVTGPDNGRDKIDAFVYDSDTEDLVRRFVRDMKGDPPAYAFLHLRDPDTQGHRWGWHLSGWHPYMRAVRKADALLGEILDVIESSPHLAGNTVVILTADHGGSRRGHGADDPAHYTIPFYVWGAGVAADDLYALNAEVREEPGANRPGFDAPAQPIRNGGVANLALELLGLDPVPGSTINVASRMRVAPSAEPLPGVLADGASAASQTPSDSAN